MTQAGSSHTGPLIAGHSSKGLTALVQTLDKKFVIMTRHKGKLFMPCNSITHLIAKCVLFLEDLLAAIEL